MNLTSEQIFEDLALERLSGQKNIWQGIVKAGDVAGHPFRGNQHTGGKSEPQRLLEKMQEHDRARFNSQLNDPAKFTAHGQSLNAYEASDKVSDGRASHGEAARQHIDAAVMHGNSANWGSIKEHEDEAARHIASASDAEVRSIHEHEQAAISAASYKYDRSGLIGSGDAGSDAARAMRNEIAVHENAFKAARNQMLARGLTNPNILDRNRSRS